MRILLAHNNYSIQGGAEVFVQEVGRILGEKGHEVELFAAAEDDLDAPSGDLFPRSAGYQKGGLIARAMQLPKAIYNQEAKRLFARMIQRFRPDVIHAFAIYVRLTPAILDAAREAGVPVVLSCNDYKHICPNYKLFHHGTVCIDCKGGRFYKALTNRCAHDSLGLSAASMVEAYVHERLNLWRGNVDIFLFASRFMAKKTEEFWGEGSIKIDFLQNPFDAEKNHVPSYVGNYVLYFGRLIDEKGVDILLDAAALAPDVPVVIVGDGPDSTKLTERARDLTNVEMVGAAWGVDLRQWLEGARAVVVPSKWHENYPYVILQAFAAALPVIASNRGGMPELVCPEGEARAFGWVYEATEARELADTMSMVMKRSSVDLESIGLAAQAWVSEQFSDKAVYTRLMAVYKRVL